MLKFIDNYIDENTKLIKLGTNSIELTTGNPLIMISIKAILLQLGKQTKMMVLDYRFQ